MVSPILFVTNHPLNGHGEGKLPFLNFGTLSNICLNRNLKTYVATKCLIDAEGLLKVTDGQQCTL